MENSFIRTSSGIQNEHLFHDVDYIVYLEGGNHSYTLEDITTKSLFNDNTLDIAFWKNQFNNHYSNCNCKFKSIGSKTVLKELSDIVISNNITSIIICMDSEFDELLNNKIQNPRVLYTYGYSWENEVFNPLILENLVILFTAMGECSDLIRTRYENFLSNIKDGVKGDYYQFSINNAFFPKKSRLKYFDIEDVALSVKVDLLHKDIESKGMNLNQLIAYELDVERYCYGHLIADFSCQLIRNHLKKELFIDCPCNEALNRSAISLYFSQELKNDEINNYYENQFKNLKST